MYSDIGGVKLGKFVKPNPMLRSLYTSADIEEDLSISFDLVDGIKHMGGILMGREIWGVIWDPIGAPNFPPKFGINGPMIPLKKLKFSIDEISNFDGAWNLRGD